MFASGLEAKAYVLKELRSFRGKAGAGKIKRFRVKRVRNHMKGCERVKQQVRVGGKFLIDITLKRRR